MRFEIKSNRCLSNCSPHLDRLRRGDYQSPVALPKIVPSIDTTVQTYNFAPLRGAFLSCFAKKGTKVRQKKATWGRRSDCAVVTLLHFGTTPDSPNSPSPKTPSAQGISSTNQIENLGSHLPRCAKLLHDTNRFLNSSINIYLTVVPAAPPCVPFQRGRSLIHGAGDSSGNIYLAKNLTSAIERRWLPLLGGSHRLSIISVFLLR